MSARDLPPCMCLRDNSEQLPLSPHVLRIYDREPVREYLHTRDVGLDVGDYSLEGMTGLVFVERKSPGDLWDSVFGKAPDNSVGEAMFNIDRLRREFFRARDHARKTLLVEVELGSFEEPHPLPVRDCPACLLEYRGEGARPACREHPPRTMVAYARRRFLRNDRRGKGPEENVLAILGFVVSFWTDYGVATQWEPGRRGAELWLGMTLTRIWDEAMGGAKAKVARERGLALPWMREQVTVGAEEASDGGRDRGYSSGGGGRDGTWQSVGNGREGLVPSGADHDAERHRGGDAGSARVPADTGRGPIRPERDDPPVRRDDGDDRGILPEPVADDAGKQGAEAGAQRDDADLEGDTLRRHADAAHGAARDVDGGRGRAAPPEATTGAVDGGAAHAADPSSLARPALLLLDAAVVVADLPCRCGGIGLGVAGFHYARAFGCCYGPAPRPCAVVAGQERGSTDGSERVAVVALRDRLWRVQRLGVPGASPGFHVEGMVLRHWPVLTREPRCDLLGVAATSEEHARRRAAPAAKPRRRRAGA